MKASVDTTRSRPVTADERDVRKTAARFFAEMPWDGPGSQDPREWSASRFLELLCGPTSGADSPP